MKQVPLWNLLKEERSINDLLSELLKEYDVDEETGVSIFYT